MCIVSVVTQSLTANPQYGQLGNYIPNQGFPALSQWGSEELNALKKALELLESIDKKMGARDCLDEQKAAFLAELDSRLKKLERKSKAR